MKISNQEISFQMQGMFNQHLYRLQIIVVEVNLIHVVIPHYCNNKVALQYAHIHNLCFDYKHT
jgi:hypothetical protein